MLKIKVPLAEAYDDEKQAFVVAETYVLALEHSLASLSKWESREEKPFLGKDVKTPDEVLRYIEDMTLTPDVPPEIYTRLSQENFEAINLYINANMTATTFREIGPQRPTRELVTAEIMYYWMVSLQIDFECQYWHLNRLITLVRVCNEKNKPAQKGRLAGRSAAAQRAEMNRQRRAQFGTTG